MWLPKLEAWRNWDRHVVAERIRRTAIVVFLIGLLLPTVLVNIGENAEQVKKSSWVVKLNRPLPSLQALLLCQQWTLFSEMSPFNFELHYLVELTDGQEVPLTDPDLEAAGKWKSILFPNEPKTELNLYGDPDGQHRYLEYLVRMNGIDPDTINRRAVYITYHNVLKREDAAKAGTHFGPEMYSALDIY
jgi:hypothetical protein